MPGDIEQFLRKVKALFCTYPYLDYLSASLGTNLLEQSAARSGHEFDIVQMAV